MNKEPSAIKKNFGELSPKLVQLTDDVLFGDVWERAELSKRDRSLVTVAALIAGGNSEQLPFHLQRAKENGVTEAELIETITHLAFYSGWPKAMSAITVARVQSEGQPKVEYVRATWSGARRTRGIGTVPRRRLR